MPNLVLHPGQSSIFNDLFVRQSVLHAVAVCTRGFGKSHLGAVSAIAAVNELMQLPAKVPNKNVFIVAPTYAQVTDIYYPLIVYQLGMDQYAIKHSKDTGKILFPNNVELRLVSYEAIERLRGQGAYFIVNDEVRDWTSGGGFKDAWESILSPCISTRWSPKHAKWVGAKSPGRSLTISTPKGYDHLYTMSRNFEVDKTYKTYQFDYTKAPLLDPIEVERVRKTTDPIKFAREYGASFRDSGANVFYCFDRDIHVRSDLEDFEYGENVHVGIDLLKVDTNKNSVNSGDSLRANPEPSHLILGCVRWKVQRLSLRGVHSSEWKRRTRSGSITGSLKGCEDIVCSMGKPIAEERY
jgi:hypothetical protein